jgi:hypothetical protein
MSAAEHAAAADARTPETGSEQLIMVIGGSESRGRRLKEMIEFMDVPRVTVASPENWKTALGDGRLAAVFVGDDLGPDAIDRLIADVEHTEPEASIVLLNGAAET